MAQFKLGQRHAYMLFVMVTATVAVLFLVTGCGRLKAERGEELSGGEGTIFDVSPNAFSLPVPGLEREQELLFFVGNSFFNQNWVTAPSSTTARDGLGPYFNARSCASCHFKDGRGRPPEFAGEMPTGLLIRLSANGQPIPLYGDQLQDQAIYDLPIEGGFIIDYVEIPITLPDGEVVYLREPIYQFNELAYGELPADLQISPRVGNQMIGLGLLEAVPDETLLALADENDSDGDGISGRPNIVPNKVNGESEIGRFGWKANQPDLLHQAADAFHGDLGITTWINPEQNCPVEACADLPNGGDVEIDDDDLAKVVLYTSSLAVPARRNWEDPTVLKGKELFKQAGCASCHTPVLETGEHPTIPALSHQTIRPYTDLLLHDMGDGLADNRPDHAANGNEWRTPPLWGIGLIKTVNGHTYFLHDGRARNLLEAILWHGGEAEGSVEFFKQLSKEDREAIIRFLESL